LKIEPHFINISFLKILSAQEYKLIAEFYTMRYSKTNILVLQLSEICLWNAFWKIPCKTELPIYFKKTGQNLLALKKKHASPYSDSYYRPPF